MRRLAILPLLLATVLTAFAEDWTTTDGKTYKDVSVVQQEDDGVRITYDGGAGKVFYSDLPVDLQKRFGEDPDTLAAKKKAADAALAQRNAVLEAERQKAAAAAAVVAAADAQKKQLAADQAAAEKAAHPAPAPVAVSHPAPPPSSQDPYPGAKYTYNAASDTCYLDSSAIDISPESGSPVPGGITSVVLRSASDGEKPSAPSRVEAIFLTAGSPPKVADTRDIVLLVNGNRTSLPATDKKDSIPFSHSGTQYVGFDLTPAQAREIVADKSVEFSSKGTTYRITPVGVSNAQTYFANVDRLPPPDASLMKLLHKFIAGIPSVVTMISVACGYVFLGAFGIFVTAFLVVMGVAVARLMNL